MPVVFQHKMQSVCEVDSLAILIRRSRVLHISFLDYLSSLRTCQSDNENMSREITRMVEEIGNLKRMTDQYEAMQSAFQDSTHK